MKLDVKTKQLGDEKPGGDGSNGVLTESLKHKLKNLKILVNRRRLPIGPGDIVYDSANKEHGIVLSEMPNDSACMLMDQLSHPDIKDREYPWCRFIVLTLSRKNEGDDTLGYRIRYSKASVLKKVEIEKENETICDLDKFCNEQCLMECSKDCALWKYKRAKN